MPTFLIIMGSMLNIIMHVGIQKTKKYIFYFYFRRANKVLNIFVFYIKFFKDIRTSLQCDLTVFLIKFVY